MIRKLDKENGFVSIFNPQTGFYARTGVLDEEGKDTGVDPFMTTFPELIDIGIMGHCQHGLSGLCKTSGVQCYQSGWHKNELNMSLEDYKSLMEQSKGRVFQVALGGRGDPDMHENFIEILRMTRQHNIIPNYTTSGLGMNDEKIMASKKYCGAVAVSWYGKPYTIKTIQDLVNAGVKTNIHFVLSAKSIDAAIDMVENNLFPDGINAVIFLLHKPVGLGTEDMMLKDVGKIKKFMSLITLDHPFKIGFDSCSVPAVINYATGVAPESIDTCEGGRWSAYISADMVIMPCSFDQDHRWSVSLREYTIQGAWESKKFDAFRLGMKESCPSCSVRASCMGGCPIKKNVVLCDRKERSF